VQNGQHHDLQQLTDHVHRSYFATAPRLPVRWGKQVATSRRRRSIRLGSYDHSTSIIRVHPSLDAPHVPAFFIQSIIYHEYLHHVLGAPHNARFHRHERQFYFHREAKEWLKLNLPVLLGRKKIKAPRPAAPAPAVLPPMPRRIERPRTPLPLSSRPVQLSLF
jgi:hypothetical protein